jgi:ActR/RegA family two-component response regulator
MFDRTEWKGRRLVTLFDQPFAAPEVATLPAKAVFEAVLGWAGAALPIRDAVDARIVSEARKGTGSIIDSPRQVGGWPVYRSGRPLRDQDGDGIPDAWEKAHGLNPRDASDASADRDGDGYSNLEEYLNELASPDRRIDAASSGREALGLLESTPYDLVLTGGSTPASVVQSLRDQAFTYFSKPFSQEAVAHMISQALTAAAWEDDIEVLSAQSEWISLRVRCRLGTAERLIQFLREMEVSLTAQQRDEVAMAFHELLVNAIEHGGQCDSEKRLRLTCIRTSRVILYHIADPGEGFSIEELPHVAVSNPAGEPWQHVHEREQRGVRDSAGAEPGGRTDLQREGQRGAAGEVLGVEKPGTDAMSRVSYNEWEARVAKPADAKDLKSFGGQPPCGFKSHPGHQLSL